MKQIFILALLISFLGTTSAFAQSHFKVDARARTKPQSVNLIATAAYDWSLWGDPSQGAKDPRFGFVSLGTRFGGSPTVSAYFQISPISPVILEVERSRTERFSRTVNFPCDSVDCRGHVDRTDFTLKLAGAYQDFIFLGTAMWRELQTPISDKPVMIELEDMVVTPGNHRFTETTFLVGKKLDELQTAGLLLSAGRIVDSSNSYQSTYAVYRIRQGDWQWIAGAGEFRADEATLTGFSAILSVSRTWGHGLSLF